MHEPEPRVDLVMIEEQTLAVAWFETQFFGCAVAHDLKRLALLDSRQDADQPFLDAVRQSDRAGDLFLVGAARRQITHRPAGAPRPVRRGGRASASDAARSRCVSSCACVAKSFSSTFMVHR